MQAPVTPTNPIPICEERKSQAIAEKFAALRQSGLAPATAIKQLLDDAKREKGKPDNGLNRVEWAFAKMPKARKIRLLQWANVIAAEHQQAVRLAPDLALKAFSQDERAFIACALKEMGAIRGDFPQNLRAWEFHPKAEMKFE